MIRKIYRKLLIKLRILKYSFLSSGKIDGSPIRIQPLLVEGIGLLKVGKKVQFGISNASLFFTTYCYIGTRSKNALIYFKGNNYANNNLTIISEGEGIEIGEYTIIGQNVSIFDSDFHNIDPNKRMTPVETTSKVVIGDNVWIGNNVTVLKGVNIGNNTIIANGSIVTKSIPANVVAGGVPCKIIKEI